MSVLFCIGGTSFHDLRAAGGGGSGLVKEKSHSVTFFFYGGAKARSVASKLFTKQDDYATRVGLCLHKLFVIAEHSVAFFFYGGAKARSVASKLFTKQDDYATRVGKKSHPSRQRTPVPTSDKKAKVADFVRLRVQSFKELIYKKILFFLLPCGII